MKATACCIVGCLTAWFVLPAIPCGAAHPSVTGALAAAESLLRTRLASLPDRYRYILLDCPPSLGYLTVNSLTAADRVLIPLQCEYYAMEGLSLLLDTIRKIKLRWNSRLAIEGIVLTMFDRRNNLAHQVANEIRSHLSFRVFRTLIPRNVRLSESPSYGLPAILYDPQCAGARAYLELAEEFHNNGQGALDHGR